MPTIYYVAWWNVENLFDYENSPRRTDKLHRVLGGDLVGWTPELRDRKIDQLVSVIAAMNGGNGPDLLGVCEVENEWILNRLKDWASVRLPARSYSVVHADTKDERGIDVAFIYDDRLLTAPPTERFHHVVTRRAATREILQINFQTHRGRTWSVFGNHWPSRSGGQYESAGYRAIAGETLSYFHQRAREVHGDDTPVLVMGDFNDQPYDESLTRHALSTRERTKVVNSTTSPRLWNLMWSVTGQAQGTFYFDNFANVFDQFLVSKHMVLESVPMQALPNMVAVENGFPGIASLTSDYPKPIRFGGMGKPVNQNGFSDHFPISMQVIEAD